LQNLSENYTAIANILASESPNICSPSWQKSVSLRMRFPQLDTPTSVRLAKSRAISWDLEGSLSISLFTLVLNLFQNLNVRNFWKYKMVSNNFYSLSVNY
jgi:hypothetical protein